MSAFKGYDANVTWAGGHANATVNAHEWSLAVEADELDITGFTSTGWRKYIAGLKNWSGSFTVRLDDTLAMPEPGGIETELKVLISAAFGFKGDAYCASINPTTAVEGTGSCTVNFRGVGALIIGAV